MKSLILIKDCYLMKVFAIAKANCYMLLAVAGGGRVHLMESAGPKLVAVAKANGTH